MTFRNRYHVAVTLLLALSNVVVGVQASAVPKIPQAGAKKQMEQEMLVREAPQCTIDSDDYSSDACMAIRGGSESGLIVSGGASSTLKLGIAGLVGAWLATRRGISKSLKEFWKEAERTKFLLAGAVAGIVSRTAVSPLEVIATAQMVRGGNKGILAELSGLFQSEGIKGFFKGNGANCLKVAPTRGVQFFAFESFKLRLVAWKRTRLGLSEDADVELTPLERLVAGGFAGMIASSLVYPIEVVKTMLTMYPGKYNGIAGAFQGVLAEVGPKGLYAGLAPTLIAMFPYVGVEFMIYETSKIAIEKFLQTKADDDARTKGLKQAATTTLPIIISLGLGAMAGAAAQSSAHPLDVVRKRLQVQGINGNPVLYKNTFDAIGGIASKEGMGALYKGLGPACVATIPGTGIAYITYEFMKTLLGLSSV